MTSVVADQDRVFVVPAFPEHESHQEVLAKCQLALIGGGTVGQHLTLHDVLVFRDDGTLIDRGALI